MRPYKRRNRAMVWRDCHGRETRYPPVLLKMLEVQLQVGRSGCGTSHSLSGASLPSASVSDAMRTVGQHPEPQRPD